VGLFNFLFPPDPSKAWVPDPGLALDVDLDLPALSGLRLGDPAAGISRFGPPENPRPSRHGIHDYASRGFQVDADAGRVECFLFRWDSENPVRRFQGRFRRNGAPLALDASTDDAAVKAAFGEPYWVDPGPEEQVWFYEWRGGTLEWQVELVQGRLRVLSLIARPVLAEPGQRESYHVTRPWPPL